MRKTICILCMGVFFSETISAQSTNTFAQWFNNNVHVANSMQTLDLSERPAAFQITLPKSRAPSYLINLGIAVVLDRHTQVNFVSDLNAEYHRNTMTDAEQNSFSAGYGFKWLFVRAATTDYFMTGDMQYVYDGEHIVNSLAGTFLFTLFRDGKKMNWNTHNFRLNNRFSYEFAPFAGVQMQDAFKSRQKNAEGFILRPLFRVHGLLALHKKEGPPFDKILALYCDYTGRTDLINSAPTRERYSQLLHAGINYYLAYSPFEVSVGTSYNSGSDPLNGLAKQRYWQISVNFLK